MDGCAKIRLIEANGPGQRPRNLLSYRWRRSRSVKQETEVEILKIAAKLLGEDRPGPKGFTEGSTTSSRRAIGANCVAVFWQVSSPGYYEYKKRPISPTQMRRLWLTGLINEVHVASRETLGSRRVLAELTIGM